MQKLRRHEREEPPPVTAARADVPPGLPAVLARLMAKRPEDRYQTPNEAALALGVFCGAPAVAPPAAAERPVAIPLGPGSATPGGAPVALPVTIPVAVPQAVSDAESLADSGQETLPPVRPVAVPVAAPSRLARLRAQLRRRPRTVAAAGAAVLGLLVLLIVLALRRDAPRPEPAPERPAWLSQVPEWVRLRQTLGERRLWHTAPVASLVIDAEGKRMATASNNQEKFIRISDPNTLLMVDTIPLPFEALPLLLMSRDGKRLLVWGAGGAELAVVDVDRRAVVHHIPLDSQAVTAAALSNDGRWLLAGNKDREIVLWDIDGDKRRRVFKSPAQVPTALAFSPDGARAISSGDGAPGTSDYDIHLWDLRDESRDTPTDWKGHTAGVEVLAWSPRGDVVVSSGLDSARWWDPSTGRPIGEAMGRCAFVTFSGDGRLVACSNRVSGPVNVYDVATRKHQRELGGPGPAAFPADPVRVVSVSGPTARVWDWKTGKAIPPPVGHLARVVKVEFAPGGGRLASSGQWESLIVWDLPAGKPVQQFPSVRHTGGRFWSPRGDRVVTAPADGQLKVWDVGTGKEQRSINVAPPTMFGFVGDRELIEVKQQGQLVRHNVESGEAIELGQLKELSGPLAACSSTGDGSGLLRTDGSLLSLVDLHSPEADRRWNVASGGIRTDAAVSTDKRFVFYGTGKLLGVSDLSTSPPGQHTYLGNHDAPPALALAPDGNVVATGDATGKMVLWNARYFPEGKGDQILAEWTQPVGVTAMTFSPDGRQLGVGNEDGTVFLYGIESPNAK
jgi:WD40 repeat protein